MIGDNYEKSLPCTLTEDELRQNGLTLARLIAKHEEVESEKKLANNGFKERIDEINSSLRKISRIVADGREWRLVEVYEALNREELKVETIRTDTGEIVSRRDPTPDERQQTLFKDEQEKLEKETDDPPFEADKGHPAGQIDASREESVDSGD